MIFSQFTIKEIDIGMAADLGTLQFFPKIIGNQSNWIGKFEENKEKII